MRRRRDHHDIRDGLRQEVDRLLQRRSGWSFQAMSVPGSPPAWCFGTGHEPTLTVTVEGGSVHVYEVEADFEVELATAGELADWLATHHRGALGEQRSGVGERLRGGRFFRWE